MDFVVSRLPKTDEAVFVLLLQLEVRLQTLDLGLEVSHRKAVDALVGTDDGLEATDLCGEGFDLSVEGDDAALQLGGLDDVVDVHLAELVTACWKALFLRTDRCSAERSFKPCPGLSHPLPTRISTAAASRLGLPIKA